MQKKGGHNATRNLKHACSCLKQKHWSSAYWECANLKDDCVTFTFHTCAWCWLSFTCEVLATSDKLLWPDLGWCLCLRWRFWGYLGQSCRSVSSGLSCVRSSLFGVRKRRGRVNTLESRVVTGSTAPECDQPGCVNLWQDYSATLAKLTSRSHFALTFALGFPANVNTITW